MTGSVRGWRRIALDAWPFALAVLLCFPLLTRSGHPLARDLIFVPRQPLTDGSIGLGTGAPRAVPLDAVVALLSHVVDGGVLARVALPLILAAAGWGTHRLVASAGDARPARRRRLRGLEPVRRGATRARSVGAAGGVRRAPVAGRARAPVPRGRAGRAGDGGALDRAGLAHADRRAAGLAGDPGVRAGPGAPDLVAGARCASCCSCRGWSPPCSARRRSGPIRPGVAAFSSDADGPGGVLVSLLGLGGIWDSHSVPTTRESWWTPITAAVVVVVLAATWRASGHGDPRSAGPADHLRRAGSRPRPAGAPARGRPAPALGDDRGAGRRAAARRPEVPGAVGAARRRRRRRRC